MTRNNELKGTGIKTRTYCYFDDMMNVNFFFLRNIYFLFFEKYIQKKSITYNTKLKKNSNI